MAHQLIEVRDLCKDYHLGGEIIRALKYVDLDIQYGEFVAVMGPSGSGKSTLMNILGCLDRPTFGDYKLDGRPVSGLKENDLAAVRNKQIGFVFQTFNLLPRSTAEVNVELPLLYSGPPRREGLAREALDRVGLVERAKHRPGELSGGQQQRVAIARALANNPDLILADEPTGNLDSKTGREILGLFQQLNDEGRTIVMVTHEEEIARHCKRIVRFLDGEVVSDEPVAERLDARSPANLAT